jgi:nucleotide-binding universal stress UspA family protein
MKILIAVDGSADALQAVRYTVALVQRGLAASLVLANVQEPASLYEMVVVHDTDNIEDLRRQAGADLLAPAEAMLQAAGLSFESEVAGGDPQHLLVELAENYGCQAIVLGARGEMGSDFATTGFGVATSLGSVAQAVLSHSPVPVTVVRARAPGEMAGLDL